MWSNVECSSDFYVFDDRYREGAALALKVLSDRPFRIVEAAGFRPRSAALIATTRYQNIII
jgi:hypothetical protein